MLEDGRELGRFFLGRVRRFIDFGFLKKSCFEKEGDKNLDFVEGFEVFAEAIFRDFSGRFCANWMIAVELVREFTGKLVRRRLEKVEGKIGTQWVAGSRQQAACWGGSQESGVRCQVSGNEKSPRAGWVPAAGFLCIAAGG